MRLLYPLIALLLLPTAALAYVDLGLRLSSSAPIHEFSEMEISDRLDLIDRLEADWDQLSEAEIIGREQQIAEVYATSPLIKHRIWALEMLEARGYETEITLDMYVIQASIRERFRNYPEAIRTLERAVELFPDQARAHRELARVNLDLGLRTQSGRRLETARVEFEAALACEDSELDDYVGLAGLFLIVQDDISFREVVTLMQEEHPVDTPATMILSALAAESSGKTASATQLLQQAAELVGGDLERWFENAAQFFEKDDAPSFVQASTLGTAAAPSLLRWWARIIETEVFFAVPDHEVNGWNTPPGRVYLRYGMPLKMKYFGPQVMDNEDVQSALGDWNLSVPDTWVDPGQSSRPAFWVWVYQMNGRTYPVVFRQFSTIAEWRFTPETHHRFAVMKNEVPLSLPPRDHSGRFDLWARHAAFRAADDRVRVETYMALRRVQKLPEGAVDAYRITLVVHDMEGNEVDRTQTVLDASCRRDNLLRVAGRESFDSTIVHQVGANLKLGDYLVSLEVEDLYSGEYRASERNVQLLGPTGDLEVSDLQLADAYLRYRPGMEIPPQFVKYAHVVVPHAEESVPVGEDFYVYYEVAGAGIDGTYQTNLDVIYEVFPEKGFDSFNTGLPANQLIVQPAFRTEFVNERSGRSENGSVIKGTRIEISELREGKYVLAVIVSDNLRRQEMRRFLQFSIEAPPGPIEVAKQTRGRKGFKR